MPAPTGSMERLAASASCGAARIRGSCDGARGRVYRAPRSGLPPSIRPSVVPSVALQEGHAIDALLDVVLELRRPGRLEPASMGGGVDDPGAILEVFVRRGDHEEPPQ